jgi:hypothetical protein
VRGGLVALEPAAQPPAEDMDAPGDANASIGNVANCSCSLGFVKG